MFEIDNAETIMISVLDISVILIIFNIVPILYSQQHFLNRVVERPLYGNELYSCVIMEMDVLEKYCSHLNRFERGKVK